MLKRIVYWFFAFTIIISEQGASVQFLIDTPALLLKLLIPCKEFGFFSRHNLVSSYQNGFDTEGTDFYSVSDGQTYSL